jgi:hypothetical protein
MNSLQNIYRRKARTPGWYKKSKGGECPDNDKSLAQTYWNSFGCTHYDTPSLRREKRLSAKKCASERMADMNYFIRNGNTIDIGHIYPIAVAYGLGKKCIELPGSLGDIEEYKNTFRNWYNELVSGSDVVHRQFQQQLNTNSNYPLNSYNPDTNNSIIYAQRVNPIILSQNMNNYKSNSSKSSNDRQWKTISSKKQKKHISSKTRRNMRNKKNE